MRKFIFLIVLGLLVSSAEAGTITYNASHSDCYRVLRATNGGTVFSADLAGETDADLFTDTAVVDDAIYFSSSSSTYYVPYLSDLKLNIGTALVADAITLKWEYYHIGLTTWVDIPNLTDDTNSFQNLGVNTVEFPVPAYSYFTSVNEENRLYIRVRISAVTNLTEGGAITTDTFKVANGIVYMVDYTEGSPLTSTILYDWIIANTVIPARRLAFYFEFPCWLQNAGDSYWVTENEIIFTGNGAGFMHSSLGKFIAGEAIGTLGGTNGTVLLACVRTGAPTLNVSGAELYASYIKDMSYYDEANDYFPAAPPSPKVSLGTVQAQATAFQSAGFQANASVLRRCLLDYKVSGLATAELIDSDNITDAMLSGSGYLLLVYANSQVYRDIVWNLGNDLIGIHPTSTGKVAVTFINLTPALPQAATGSAPYLLHLYTNNTDFLVYECWTLDLKVIDDAGDAIEGATITLLNNRTSNNDTFQDTTTTAESVDDSETDITVADALGISATDYVRMGREIMLVDSVAGDVLTVTRGQMDTHINKVGDGEKVYKLVTSLTTDANGEVEELILQSRRFYYDAESGNYENVEQEEATYNINISKTGYRTVEFTEVTPTKPLDLLVELDEGDTVIYDSTLIDCIIY